MFDSFALPVEDFEGSAGNAFVAGYLSRSRVREVDRRVLGERVAAAWQLFQEVEIMLAASVAAFDSADAWVVDGALSPTGWLRNRLGVSHGHAQRMLQFARGLSGRVEVADAVTDAVLSADKARQILERFTKARAAYAERDVDMLIAQAARLSVAECRTFMSAWAARVDAEIESEDPHEPSPDPDEPEASSELFVSEIADGQVIVNGSLAPELGETVRTALDLARKLLEGEDPSELPTDSEKLEQATPSPASESTGPVDERSRAEQRAEALGLIARFFLDHNDDIELSAGNRPHVHVEIDLDVVEERAGGIGRTRHSAYGLSAEDVRRILCDSNISRVVMSGASVVLDIGRKTRVVPVALAKAVRRRDRQCRFPGCNAADRFSDIHHGVHWSKGGPTSRLNCYLLCYRHHRMMHGPNAWTSQGDPNGVLTFTAPNGDSYATAPPGTLH